MNLIKFKEASWSCIHYVDAERYADHKDVLVDSGNWIEEIDVASVKNDKTLFSLIATAFNFPDYFGYNWNALDECLRDLEMWLPAKGYVLVLRNSATLWQNAVETSGQLVHSWLFCAEEWARADTPFHLVFVLE